MSRGVGPAAALLLVCLSAGCAVPDATLVGAGPPEQRDAAGRVVAAGEEYVPVGPAVVDAPRAAQPAPIGSAIRPRVAPPVPGSPALSVQVPSLGLTSGPAVDLGLAADGTMEVPTSADTLGWYTGGPLPGAVGPAVLAAHVNYRGRPGLFARLGEITPGAEVLVPRADGSTAVFVVYRVHRYPKAEFPTARVFGGTDGAELRLITCGGIFDRGSGHYTDNVVAYAQLADLRPAA